MKRDRIKTLLLAEALICALLALALWLFEGDAFSVAGFPGSAVGQGLSALAASGRFGFALAFTLYAAVILLPLYVLVRIGARRELKPEDALLVLIAFAAACALFPHGGTAYWSTSAEALFPRLAWQWLIFALLAGWVVLRLLRRLSGGDTQELLKLFRALLILAAAYFVFEVCFAEFAGLFSVIDALKAGNTAFTADTVLPVATDIRALCSAMLSSPCALPRKSFLRCSPRRRRTSPSAFSTRWKTARLRRRAPPTRQSSPNGASRCSSSACCLRSRSTFCRRSVRRCS